MRKLFAGIGLLLSFSAYAGDLHPVLYLNTITQVKSADAYGDDLYFVITEYNANNKNKQYTLPNYPIHWPAEALPKLKDLKVWEGVVPEGQSVDLVVELVEHDAPPFDVDDSIGAMKIKLTNKDGKLVAVWLDDQTATHTSEKNGKKVFEIYEFTGAGGEYRLKFYLGDTATKLSTLAAKTKQKA